VRDFSGTAALVADEVGISKNRCWFRSAVAAWVEPRVAGTRRFGGVLGGVCRRRARSRMGGESVSWSEVK